MPNESIFAVYRKVTKIESWTKKAAQSFTDERLTLLQFRIIQRELLLLQVLLSQEPQQVPRQPSLKNDVYA